MIFLPTKHSLLDDVLFLKSEPMSMQEMQNPRNLRGIYCTFESSFLTGADNLCRSPSTGSISGNGSSTVSLLDPESSSSDSQEIVNLSPANYLCSTREINNLGYQLKELETAMMDPTSDNSDTENWQQLVEMVSRRELKEVLIACAKAVSNDDLLTAEWLISELQNMVSVSGEPIQRLGAYMLEGLIARFSSSGISIYRSLKCNEPTSSELLSYMQLLYEVCPYFKFGYMSANGAIADALKNEDRIHIIDFQIAQGSQWVSLIQALAARPGGPPRVRITGLDDTTSEFARGGGLNIVRERLSKLAKACNLPFEFNAAKLTFGPGVIQNLELQSDEALAVNFPFLLHHIPDESVGPENHRDSLLRLIKSWSPKVVTLVEYDLNTNTSPFYPRFLETLHFYSAIFESINVTLSKDHKERINVEKNCLAREIVNIIACEGAERVERHERHGKWRSRFLMAGFRPYPLSPLVNATIRTLLQKYSTSYGLEERDGALYLGWMNRVLVTSCAWQ